MQYPHNDQAPAKGAPYFDGSQACAGVDVELFFPPRGSSAQLSVRRAKQLCAGCPFQAACLEYAMTAQGASGVYVDGVWGGTTAAERRALRCGRGRIRHLNPRFVTGDVTAVVSR